MIEDVTTMVWLASVGAVPIAPHLCRLGLTPIVLTFSSAGSSQSCRSIVSIVPTVQPAPMRSIPVFPWHSLASSVEASYGPNSISLDLNSNARSDSRCKITRSSPKYGYFTNENPEILRPRIRVNTASFIGSIPGNESSHVASHRSQEHRCAGRFRYPGGVELHWGQPAFHQAK